MKEFFLTENHASSLRNSKINTAVTSPHRSIHPCSIQIRPALQVSLVVKCEDIGVRFLYHVPFQPYHVEYWQSCSCCTCMLFHCHFQLLWAPMFSPFLHFPAKRSLFRSRARMSLPRSSGDFRGASLSVTAFTYEV